MKSFKEKKSRKYIFSCMIFCLVLLALIEISKSTFLQEADIIYSFLSRIVGIILCILIAFYCSYTRIFKISFSKIAENLLFILPCLFVAINNFPIVPYITGNAYISTDAGAVMIFLLECLTVGLFEELAFRGIVFMMILEKKRKTQKDIFLSVIVSSLIFGAIHIFNIFTGASLIPTLLQLGYSFLVGGMCSVIFLKTECIWYSVLIHTLYNFAGDIVPTLGGGILWDTPRIVITVLLTVTVAIYLIYALLKLDLKRLDKIFK